MSKAKVESRRGRNFEPNTISNKTYDPECALGIVRRSTYLGKGAQSTCSAPWFALRASASSARHGSAKDGRQGEETLRAMLELYASEEEETSGEAVEALTALEALAE